MIETKRTKPKKKSVVIDFIKAVSEKATKEMEQDIISGKFYDELRPKKKTDSKIIVLTEWVLIRINKDMNVKERLNLTIEQELKEKAEKLSLETGYSISVIFELLIKGTSESEIVKMYKQNLKGK